MSWIKRKLYTWKRKAFATVQIGVFLHEHSKNVCQNGKITFSFYSSYCKGGCEPVSVNFIALLTSMGGSPSELSEELVMQEKRKKGWRMNCDVM